MKNPESRSQESEDSDNVVPFSLTMPGNDFPNTVEAAQSVASDPETVPDQPGDAPWDVVAAQLAAEAYRMAHGLGPATELGSDEHKARMAMIQRLLAPELRSGLEAGLAWAGVTLYLRQVQHALRHVVLGAEVHPPSKGRHNERVLVYADRLSALADLVQKQPAAHKEAAAWWKEREAQLQGLAELPRIIAAVERQMGGAPDEAKKHTPVENIEGMLMGLMGIVTQQKELLERQGKRNKDLLEANEKLLRRVGGR